MLSQSRIFSHEKSDRFFSGEAAASDRYAQLDWSLTLVKVMHGDGSNGSVLMKDRRGGTVDRNPSTRITW